MENWESLESKFNKEYVFLNAGSIKGITILTIKRPLQLKTRIYIKYDLKNPKIVYLKYQLPLPRGV